ncbi:hypothetical protein SAMN05444161_8705 [Rhizobiales bacterium GAS191]|nr:hypothetical protein SAMN05444161_8705 [Rhizobiales bacterium GAS191]
MTQTTSPTQMTGEPLIASDRVEGTAVYYPNGKSIGSGGAHKPVEQAQL